MVDLGRLHGDQLSSLQASLVLLLEHIDLKIVMLLQKAQFILEPLHGVLRVL